MRMRRCRDQDALQRLDQGLQGLETEAGSRRGRPDGCRPAPSAIAVGPPGPDANQVAAAAQMAPTERNNMIESMVARLAQRMAENGFRRRWLASAQSRPIRC